MSFKESVYKSIDSGDKKFEFRSRFPRNCSYAFIYVSNPVKSIMGIIYFGKTYTIEEFLESEESKDFDKEKLARYQEKFKFVKKIEKIDKIQPITLDELRQNVKKFFAPQSYLLLENFVELNLYIKSRIKYIK